MYNDKNLFIENSLQEIFKKRNIKEEYMYMIILPEFIENELDIVVKIGKTMNIINRKNNYPIGSLFINIRSVYNCTNVENKVIKEFDDIFIKRLEYGYEYYSCKDDQTLEDMILLFDDICDNSMKYGLYKRMYNNLNEVVYYDITEKEIFLQKLKTDFINRSSQLVKTSIEDTQNKIEKIIEENVKLNSEYFCNNSNFSNYQIYLETEDEDFYDDHICLIIRREYLYNDKNIAINLCLLSDLDIHVKENKLDYVIIKIKREKCYEDKMMLLSDEFEDLFVPVYSKGSYCFSLKDDQTLDDVIAKFDSILEENEHTYFYEKKYIKSANFKSKEKKIYEQKIKKIFLQNCDGAIKKYIDKSSKKYETLIQEKDHSKILKDEHKILKENNRRVLQISRDNNKTRQEINNLVLKLDQQIKKINREAVTRSLVDSINSIYYEVGDLIIKKCVK